MEIINTVNQLELCLGLFLFVWFFYGPWNQYVTDALRQYLFDIRDEIFLLAADGKINFSHPAYSAIRERLNLTIRFAHRISFGDFVSFTLLYSKSDELSSQPDITQLTNNIVDRDVARLIERRYLQMVIAVTVSMVLRSFVALVLNIVFIPFFVINAILNGAKKNVAMVGFLDRALAKDLIIEQAVT